MGPEARLTQQEREAIEGRLSLELKQAREDFDRAKHQFDLTTAEARALGLHTSDGAYVLHLATREYNQALGQYGTAVKRFSQFILHGTLPTA